MLRKFFLKITFFGLSATSFADTPATHGMLLFGLQKTYVSHLPMFHAPHDYQFISEVLLEDLPRSFVVNKYEKLQSEGESLFTIEPSKTDLTQIINGTQKSILAQVYQGHFERGGKLLGSVVVNFKTGAYAAKLKPVHVFPKEDQYLVFGAKGEYFAAHMIEGKPNLDLIAKVTAPFTLNRSRCMPRQICPEPLRAELDDTQLPILLSNGTQNTSNFLSLNEGEIFGVGTPKSQVLKVIYEEREELSH